MMMSHRLRAVRSAVALSAVVSRPEARRPEGRRQDAFTSIVNLSGTGALLATDRTYTEGDVVHLRFSLPGMAEVQTEARVARVVGQGQVGVTFERLEDRTAEMIVRHVVLEERRRLARAV
ncbi:MAG: PilZ domain-containing protein [Candidatus Sericytochromatia bacterium]